MRMPGVSVQRAGSFSSACRMPAQIVGTDHSPMNTMPLAVSNHRPRIFAAYSPERIATV